MEDCCSCTYEIIALQGKELCAIHLSAEDMNTIKQEIIKVVQKKVVDKEIQQALEKSIKSSQSCGLIFKDIPTAAGPEAEPEGSKGKKHRKSKVELLVLAEKE